MSFARSLRQTEIVDIVATLYEGDLHAKRVLSLANATLGVLGGASLAVHAIGQGLTHAQGTISKHGVKQVDRLLSNRNIEVEALLEHWVPYIVALRYEVVWWRWIGRTLHWISTSSWCCHCSVAMASRRR